MGVSNLWEVLYPTAESRSLPDLAIKLGFMGRAADVKRAFVLGIDVGCWFAQVENCKNTKVLNYQLQILYYRCCWLAETAVKAIFIFDGPGRPENKRGKSIAVDSTHYLVKGFCEIIDAFGFEFHMAPGEAEAELAFFNRIGLIDSVMTDDVDALIFGAQTVIRNRSAKVFSQLARNSNCNVDDQHLYVFTAEKIRQSPKTKLTQGGLILMALFCGGDYKMGGVPGMDIKRTLPLALAGHGDSLLHAMQTLESVALETFIRNRKTTLVNELRTNKSCFYNGVMLKEADSLSRYHFDIAILRLYCTPVVSQFSNDTNLEEFKNNLWKKEFNIGKIAYICEHFFQWDLSKDILPHIQKRMCRAAIIQLCITHGHKRMQQEPQTGLLSLEEMLIKIHSRKQRVPMAFLPEYYVETCIEAFAPIITSVLQNQRKEHGDHILAHLRGESCALSKTNFAIFSEHIFIHLPVMLVIHAMPGFSLEYTSKESKKKPGRLSMLPPAGPYSVIKRPHHGKRSESRGGRDTGVPLLKKLTGSTA